jgi:phosphatidylglycerol---prolipoprotein diacylglyceryl transferase
MNTIGFPGLWGLELTINRVAFEVFGIDIYWYGIIQALAFLVAVVLGMRESKKYGLEPDNIIDLVLFVIPAAIIGARLFYVLFNWVDFKDNLLEVFNTRNGGMTIYGGLILAFAVVVIFARVKKIGILHLFDFGIVYMPIAQAIGRWGNFVNQEAFGINTELPWGMISDSTKSYLTRNYLSLQNMGVNVDPNLPVHPTFLYECIWNIGVFAFLLWYRKRKKKDGDVFLAYLVFYGIIRFITDGIRADALLSGRFNVLRLSAAAVIMTAVVIYLVRVFKSRNIKGQYDEVELGDSEYGAVLKKMDEENNED